MDLWLPLLSHLTFRSYKQTKSKITNEILKCSKCIWLSIDYDGFEFLLRAWMTFEKKLFSSLFVRVLTDQQRFPEGSSSKYW